MTPLVWANFPLALLFVLAWVGIPPWMAHHDPDYAAYPYLAAKAANTTGGKPETGYRCRLSSADGNREEPRGDTAIPALTSQRRRRRLPGVRPQGWTFWPLGVHALAPQASAAAGYGPLGDAA